MINDYQRNKNDHSMSLEPIGKVEIHNIVSLFCLKRSMDYHYINMYCIKYIIASITKSLMLICNLLFITGIFSNEMKIVRVMLIFKNKHKLKKYRPISILSQFKKIILKMLNKYIEKFRILSDNQYGFREGYSTAMALTELIDNIATAIDKKLHKISVFLHLEKAFDTIDHPLLLKKLGHYGIRGIANHWLSSYLVGRKYYVEIKNCKSKLMQIMCGVPQG